LLHMFTTLHYLGYFKEIRDHEILFEQQARALYFLIVIKTILTLRKHYPFPSDKEELEEENPEDLVEIRKICGIFLYHVMHMYCVESFAVSGMARVIAKMGGFTTMSELYNAYFAHAKNISFDSDSIDVLTLMEIDVQKQTDKWWREMNQFLFQFILKSPYMSRETWKELERDPKAYYQYRFDRHLAREEPFSIKVETKVQNPFLLINTMRQVRDKRKELPWIISDAYYLATMLNVLIRFYRATDTKEDLILMDNYVNFRTGILYDSIRDQLEGPDLDVKLVSKDVNLVRTEVRRYLEEGQDGKFTVRYDHKLITRIILVKDTCELFRSDGYLLPFFALLETTACQFENTNKPKVAQVVEDEQIVTAVVVDDPSAAEQRACLVAVEVKPCPI
jgi:hypothetical protein